ncbi:I78 family peptidase inhibitor [Streptomyces sp. NPDC018029]|uniref:I78 family peptidase inhibitor n=1 Tax=Streptomyces sp. NPDC018029 TaxID=3365032 RepID=UPI0037B2E5D1
MAPIPTPPAEPPESADSLDGYVGLTADAAGQRARERGWSTVRSLAPGTIITMEYLAGRLNFEVEEGVVRRCWKG